MSYLKYIFAFLFLGGYAINPAAALSLTAQESDAETVLMKYFDALSQGDVMTLRSLMAGELLAKRAALLSNPTYPSFLAGTYGTARFQIDSVKTVNTSTIEIDASIIFDQDNNSPRHYLLRDEASGTNLNPIFRIYEDTPQEGR